MLNPDFAAQFSYRTWLWFGQASYGFPGWDFLPAGAVLSQVTNPQHQAEDRVVNMMQFKNSRVILLFKNF